MNSRSTNIYQVLFIVFFLGATCIFSQKLPKRQLNDLIEKSKVSHSDGLVIYQGDQLIHEWYPNDTPKLVDIKSVTKSVTNLAIGYLVSKGKLDIDQPVYDFYPEWNQENKREITIRHLLTHTSGLLDSDFGLVENTSDIIQFALVSDLTHPLGKYYIYNNKAVNLLAGIIEKADGRKLDRLMKEEIFTPLGITTFEWPKDEKGNPYVMAFLKMYPRDLAKIGLLVLNQGKWEGKQLINAGWFNESMQPGADFMPEYGLLWELLTENFRFIVDNVQLQSLKDAGVDRDLIEKAETMHGEYDSRRAYSSKLRAVYGKDYRNIFRKELVPHGVTIGRKHTDGVWGYAGIGYLGQYLVIDPQEQIVTVRLINHFNGYNWDTDEFREFPELIKGLTK